MTRSSSAIVLFHHITASMVANNIDSVANDEIEGIEAALASASVVKMRFEVI